MDIKKIQADLRSFAAEREWEQFHNPKNLAMAVGGECGELLEIFQWLTDQQSQKIMLNPKKSQAVCDEIADILIYIMRLADVLEIDLDAAISAKLQQNAEKYPKALSKGNAIKYTDLR